jgi:hypothetical protein
MSPTIAPKVIVQSDVCSNDLSGEPARRRISYGKHFSFYLSRVVTKQQDAFMNGSSLAWRRFLTVMTACWMVLTLTSAVLAFDDQLVPEIDSGSIAGAITVLTGAGFLIADKFRRRVKLSRL